MVSYVQTVTQHFESRTVRKTPLQSMHNERNGAVHPSYINYHLKSEVFIILRCWLCSTHYTGVQIKNCSKSTSGCNQNSHYEKYKRFPFEGKPSHATTKSTFFAVSKDEWDTKEDTGKSMKNVLYVLRYAKRHLLYQGDVEQ